MIESVISLLFNYVSTARTSLFETRSYEIVIKSAPSGRFY